MDPGKLTSQLVTRHACGAHINFHSSNNSKLMSVNSTRDGGHIVWYKMQVYGSTELRAAVLKELVVNGMFPGGVLRIGLQGSAN